MQAAGRQGARFVLDLAHQFIAGLISGQAGDALQFLQVAATRFIQRGLLAGVIGLELGLLARAFRFPVIALALDIQILAAQILLPPVERRGLVVDGGFLLLYPPLDAVDFLPTLREFTIKLGSQPDCFVLRLESSITSPGFGFLQNAVGFSLDLARMCIRTPLQIPPSHKIGGDSDENGSEDAEDECIVHRHP